MQEADCAKFTADAAAELLEIAKAYSHRFEEKRRPAAQKDGRPFFLVSKQLEDALDKIRSKHGFSSVTSASLIDNDLGINIEEW